MEPSEDDDPWMTSAGVADYLGIKVATWRWQVRHAHAERVAGRDRPGLAPEPDQREALSGWMRWRRSTIDRYQTSRLGQGARTDLYAKAVRFQIRMNAGEHERFGPEVAQSLIGQQPPLNGRAYEGGPILADYGQTKIVAAEVIDEGKAILLTVEGKWVGSDAQ